MSRKTKADLEAEIQELLQENKELRYLANINHDQYKRCLKLLSRYRDALSKQFSGPRGNKTKADKRQAFLIQEYEYYRAIGLDDKAAREKANLEFKDQFGKGYGRTQLNKIIDKHLSK